MLEKYCDILVIGTELPGLISAAFLARRGLSVQIIESDVYADNSQMPDPLCLTSIHSKLLRSILGRLNVPEMTIQAFLEKESNLQVIFPKHRIDVFSNPLNYSDELDREFPENQGEIKSFYEELARVRHQTDVNDLFDHLIPSSWGEQRQLKKFIKQHELNEKSSSYLHLIETNSLLKAYFESQYILSNQSICHQPFTYQVAEIFNPGDGEIFSIINGFKPLKEILLERITHHGGHIRKKISPQKLLFRNSVIEGVELSGTQDTVLAKYVIWNTSLPKLGDILPNKWRYKKLKKVCNNHSSYYHWFTAKWTVPSLYIPDPMKENVIIIQDAEKELSGSNFLYLQLHKLESEQHQIDVNFLLPRSAIDEKTAFFKPYFTEIQENLTKLFPFSTGKLKHVFPLENQEKDEDTLFPLHENDYEVFLHSAEIHGVLEQKENDFSHLFPLHYKTPTPNFFISHPYIFSAFGFESKLILGLKITDLVWQETEKEKKRAMKSERRIA